MRRRENPSSHEITDYILSIRPRGLDRGGTGKKGGEEERRGGDKSNSSKLARSGVEIIYKRKEEGGV